MPDSEQHNDLSIQAGQLGTQMDIWGTLRQDSNVANPFARNTPEDEHRRIIARHKLWLDSIQHECPSPFVHFRIGVYIRFFNQTKYDNYLDYHKQQFIDTISLCPNWTLVDFYVDEGQSTPHMENAKAWCRLLDDCVHGKVNLIITQKISNVSSNSSELTFCARFLATLRPPIGPIGIYFVSEDLFTLASYYQDDMRENTYLPPGAWDQLPPASSDDSIDGWEQADEH